MKYNQLTTEQFIEKALLVHGSKYDYSKVQYVRSRDKVEIICAKHGMFLQTPNGHLDGRGCRKCGYDVAVINANATKKLKSGTFKPRKSLDQYLNKFKAVHGDRYDYSKSDEQFNGHNSKIEIICRTHGAFMQKVKSHSKGQGCPKCAVEYTTKNRKSRAMTQCDFIKKSVEKHGNKYDYSKAVYVNSNDKVLVICPTHGEFWQSPRHHWRSNGCYECGRENTGDKNSFNKSKEDFVDMVMPVQQDVYDYSLLPDVIKTRSEKIKIICSTHGVFEQSVNTHIYGGGCNKCCFRGHSKSNYVDHCSKMGYKETIVYMLNFYNSKERFLKIGITSRSIKERFRKMKGSHGYEYEVVTYFKHEPQKAWEIERLMKSEFGKYQYSPTTNFQGFTECYDIAHYNDIYTCFLSINTDI